MAKKQATTESSNTELKIIDYSERAIAIVGDTKPIKDDLKKMGGRYNPRLSCGAGWIFSKKKSAEDVAAFVDKYNKQRQSVVK